MLDLVVTLMLQLESMLEILVNRPRDSSSWYLEYCPRHNAFKKASVTLRSIDDLDGIG